MSPGQPDDSAEGLIEGILQRGEASAAPDDEPTELLTFLFADIRGYTRFTQERGDAAAARLTTAFATIVRDLVARFSGTVFELRGDEALCVFSSPRHALRAAVALQQRFIEQTIAEPALPMAVGIGIDVGEAVRGTDGYRGGALNLAARLCEQAKAGDVLASPEVAHLARTIDGIGYHAVRRMALKGLPDHVRPVRVVPDGEDPAQQIAALLAAAAPPPPPGRLARRLPWPLARRPRSTLAAATVVVAVVGGVAVAVAAREDNPLTAFQENSLGQLDTHTGALIRQAAMAEGPGVAVADAGLVWTVNSDSNTVSRFDTATHELRTITVQSAPSAITVSPDSAWVTNSGSNTVSRIDRASNNPQSIPVGVAPGGIAFVHNSIWVTNTGDGTVSRIDPSQNRVVETIPVGDNPVGIAGKDDIWVANSASRTVVKINGSGTKHAVVASIAVGNGPEGVAVVGDNVWVTNNLDGTVSRIPTNGTLAATVPIGDAEPLQIAGVAGRIWIAMQAAGTIAEVDPASLHVRTIRIGPVPGGIATDGEHLWVTTTIVPANHRGGVMQLRGGDIVSVDPNYLQEPNQGALAVMAYDGLVGLRHASGAQGAGLVPDLARELPAPTDGGRTYTFQLRDGIHWSDGNLVTVADVRHGLERSMATGTTRLPHQIVGADSCTVSACAPSGVTVDSRAETVTIRLKQPNASFLNDLTATIAVPASTPMAESRTSIVPATGPYQIKTFVPGKLVVLTANPYFHQWSAAAQPAAYATGIVWHMDAKEDDDASATRAVRAGTADWANARGVYPLGQLEAQFASRLHVSPAATLHGLMLNTSIAPFNDIRVRKALAYALDRQDVADKWFAPATVTCQLLPPNIPGYRPYCPYTSRRNQTNTWQAPDVAAANALMRGVVTRGVSITVRGQPEDAASFGVIVTALRRLGYRDVRFVAIHGDYFSYVADSRNKVQAGFFGWVSDNASVSDYFSLWSCDAITPASPTNLNPSLFCDHTIDRLMTKARSEQSTSLSDAYKTWHQVEERLVDAAPWVPLVTPSWVDVVSSRVHDYTRSLYLGVLYAQIRLR